MGLIINNRITSISIVLVLASLSLCSAQDNSIIQRDYSTPQMFAFQSEENQTAPQDTCSEQIPTLIYSEPVLYPHEAEIKGIEGNVWIKALIDTKGRVIEAQVHEPSGTNVGFEEEAVRAAYKNRYTPAIDIDCKPTAVWVAFRTVFELADRTPQAEEIWRSSQELSEYYHATETAPVMTDSEFIASAGSVQITLCPPPTLIRLMQEDIPQFIAQRNPLMATLLLANSELQILTGFMSDTSFGTPDYVPERWMFVVSQPSISADSKDELIEIVYDLCDIYLDRVKSQGKFPWMEYKSCSFARLGEFPCMTVRAFVDSLPGMTCTLDIVTIAVFIPGCSRALNITCVARDNLMPNLLSEAIPVLNTLRVVCDTIETRSP